MHCLFCNSSNNSDSYLPDTAFNNKVFAYKKCNNCGLIFIDPIPNKDDLTKLYPTSYQNGIEHTILANPHQKLIGLRYSYGYQFDLLKSINFKGTIVDFGCGNANFLINANHHGFNCIGVEYNIDHVAILKQEVSSSIFYTVEEFFSSDQQYDLIRLSNVLEHFTNPKEMLNKLIQSLSPEGYILVEGPIETNFNLANWVRKIYFSFRNSIQPSYTASHNPTHIIFTNRRNQLQFFKDLSFSAIHFKISEAEWPFPSSITSAIGLVGKINALIAKISMSLSALSPNWGNTFIYLGQKKT